jgi:hypothetical protein
LLRSVLWCAVLGSMVSGLWVQVVLPALWVQVVLPALKGPVSLKNPVSLFRWVRLIRCVRGLMIAWMAWGWWPRRTPGWLR